MTQKKKQWTPRRVTSEEERGSGSSQYVTLGEGEKFLGFALFEADPANLNDAGYYEYIEHWVQNGPKGSSVPCPGEDCPYCDDGDRPRTRAKTLWFVVTGPKGEDVNELRIFNFNYNIIKQFTELRAEGDKIKGRLFRISRLDDRGNYAIMPKDTMLKATEVKEHLADTAAPDFEALVTAQLRKAMEGVALARVLDDDDDDEVPARSTAAKKGAKAKAEEPDEETPGGEWPDEGEGVIVTVVGIDDENFLTVSSEEYEGDAVVWGSVDVDVTEFEEDQVLEISYVADDDGDLVLTDDPVVSDAESEEEEEEEETANAGDLPDMIEDVEFEITEINTEDETMEVASEDYSFTLYFLDQGPAAEIDFDDYKVGDKIIVSCEQDSQGDMVATVVPELVKKPAARKTTAKTGTRKTAATGTKKKAASTKRAPARKTAARKKTAAARRR